MLSSISCLKMLEVQVEQQQSFVGHFATTRPGGPRSRSNHHHSDPPHVRVPGADGIGATGAAGRQDSWRCFHLTGGPRTGSRNELQHYQGCMNPSLLV